jgi:hypothetical protein
MTHVGRFSSLECSIDFMINFCQIATTLIDTLSDLLAPYAPSDSHARVVQYAPRYRLAFTMLNEDAAAGQAVHGWDIQDAIARE